MSKNEELKPCPFCGSPYIEIDRTDEDFHAILCRRCWTQIVYTCSKNKAIEKWNTRPTIPLTEEEKEFRKIKSDVLAEELFGIQQHIFFFNDGDEPRWDDLSEAGKLQFGVAMTEFRIKHKLIEIGE